MKLDWRLAITDPDRDGENARIFGLGQGMRGTLALSVAGLLGAMPQTAFAEPAKVTITANAPLRFGTLMVPTTGIRTISAQGFVTDSGLFSVGGSPVGPAQFSVVYDRGNESRRVINIQIRIIFSGLQQVTVGGVVGRVSQLDTDLPSSLGTMTGTTMTLTLRGCAQRRCSASFRIGGRLDINRNYGGAELVFPLPAIATVTSVF